VLLPMLADRKGHLLALGTPAGRVNLFFEMLEMARERVNAGDPAWSWAVVPNSQTGLVSAAELELQARLMTPEEFQQEWECSFNAAVRGAFYARELERLEQEGRVLPLVRERTHEVHAALDLGYSDAMVAIFSQTVGQQERLLKAQAWRHTSIPEMLDDWEKLAWPVARVILPHDAKVRELGSGMTRREIFEARGYEVVIAPNQGIHEGINAVREMLPYVWMDAEGCAMLREAIAAYRSDYDELKRVHHTKPLHDWSSHWADALRYLALGRGMVQPWGARPKANLGMG
jgi:phage terminase large subunit